MCALDELSRPVCVDFRTILAPMLGIKSNKTIEGLFKVKAFGFYRPVSFLDSFGAGLGSVSAPRSGSKLIKHGTKI